MRIDIKGVIVSNDEKWVYDWFEMDSTAPKDVIPLIDKARGEKIDVYINSGGGDIFAGSEIYAALQAYKGQISIHIVGFAGSAASVIAMAGKSDIAPTAMFMYHNVSGGASGDYHAMDKTSEILQTANRAISKAYQIKTGKSETELLAMMDKETWLTAEEAVQQGFVDELAVNQNMRLSASFDSQMLPQSVIDKMRNEKQIPKKNDNFDIQKAKAEYEILKLKNIRGV